MEPMTQSILDVFYRNWHLYQDNLRDCIYPLTKEQLSVQPAPHMWPLQQIVQHIITVRAGWFYFTLQEKDESIQEYHQWGEKGAPDRSGSELARGLDETWKFIESCMRRWTPEEYAVTFPDEGDDGQVWQVSRNWVIYHVMEHDLHHGGEVSLILGMNGWKTPKM